MNDIKSIEDVFCIPDGNRYIIYAPLGGVVLLGNARFVNKLYRAKQGDTTVFDTLGEEGTRLKELFRPKRLIKEEQYRVQPPPFQPTSISIFLTNACTLRCLYCYAEGGSSYTEMPWEAVTGICDVVFDNVLSLGAKQMTVNFHGGGDVSAAWPLFVRARQYLEKITSDCNIVVRTSVGLNGILNRTQCEWVIRNIDSVTISIDGTPDIQDAQRPFPDGRPSFPAVAETVRHFDEANYSYGVRVTVTSQSVCRLEEIIAYFCENFAVKKIKLEPMFLRGRAGNSSLEAPDAESFVAHFREAEEIAAKAGRTLVYSGMRFGMLTDVFCQAAGESCAVTPEGLITSCYEVIRASDPLADTFVYGYYDMDKRRLVVDEDRRKRLYQLSVLNKPYCAKCFCKWHCAGDCPAKSLAKDMFGSEGLTDRCYITRELTKDALRRIAFSESSQTFENFNQPIDRKCDF